MFTGKANAWRLGATARERSREEPGYVTVIQHSDEPITLGRDRHAPQHAPT